jgi:hypothetical protein
VGGVIEIIFAKKKTTKLKSKKVMGIYVHSWYRWKALDKQDFLEVIS